MKKNEISSKCDVCLVDGIIFYHKHGGWRCGACHLAYLDWIESRSVESHGSSKRRTEIRSPKQERQEARNTCDEKGSTEAISGNRD